MNELKVKKLTAEIAEKQNELNKLNAELEQAKIEAPDINRQWCITEDCCCAKFDILYGSLDALDKNHKAYNTWPSAKRAVAVANKTKLLWLMEQIHDMICPDYEPNFEDTRVTYTLLWSCWDTPHGWFGCNAGGSFEGFVYFDTKEHAQQAAKILNAMKIMPNGEIKNE